MSAAFSYVDNLAAGRMMQALFQVEASAAREGWTATRHEQAADLWDQLGDPNRAVAHWGAAARLQPTEVGLRRLATALLSLQRWAEAEAALSELLQLAPDDAWAAYQRGLLLAPTNPTQAVEWLQQASADVNFVAAARELTELTAGDATDPEKVMQIGLWLAGRELWSQAERAFGQAAALDEQFAEAWAYRGLARDHQQKVSAPDFAQALALAPGSAHVQFIYGLHLRLNGQDAGSLTAFSTAVRLDPTNPAYAAELGLAYQVMGNLVQAREWLLRAVDLSNSDVRFQELLNRFDARYVGED
jgi:tetratricopeptide (TPR) repeat protein